MVANSVSKENDKNIIEFKQSVEPLTTEKLVVEEEVIKAQKAAEETKLTLDERKKFSEETRKALLVSEELKKNLEGRVDMAEARVASAEARAKLAENALAKMEA